jgi:hypothetical protein
LTDGLFLKQIAVIQDGRQVSSVSVNFEPSCASMNGHHPDVAVGGTTDHKVEEIDTLTRMESLQ